jgi:hypothetical protein
MKRFLVLLVFCAPAVCLAGEVYTNADLARFNVPGAFTNADLSRLEPLPVQAKPAALLPAYEPPRPPTALYQAEYDGLRRTRGRLEAELAYERGRLEFSRSAFAGDTRQPGIRLGEGAKIAPLIQELEKRVTLIGIAMEAVADEARRAGALIDRR